MQYGAAALTAAADEKRLAAEAHDLPDNEVANCSEVIAARKRRDEKRVAKEQAEKSAPQVSSAKVEEKIRTLKEEIAQRRGSLAALDLEVLLEGDLKASRAVEERAQLDWMTRQVEALESGLGQFRRRQPSIYAPLHRAIQTYESAETHLSKVILQAKVQLIKERRAGAPKVLTRG